MEVALTPELEELITREVENGRYPSPGEVIRDALRLLEERLLARDVGLASLRRDVKVGLEALDRGEHEEYDIGEVSRLADEVKAHGRHRLKESRGTGYGG